MRNVFGGHNSFGMNIFTTEKYLRETYVRCMDAVTSNKLLQMSCCRIVTLFSMSQVVIEKLMHSVEKNLFLLENFNQSISFKNESCCSFFFERKK